jgi:hypothetical protein
MTRRRASNHAGPSLRSSARWCSDSARSTLSPLGRERQEDLATVILSLLSFPISPSGKPVHQFHRAVVPDLQPLCQFSNPRARSARKAFQSQHQLMSAGFKSYFANSKLTEVKKASDMVPQVGQGLVVLRCEGFFHAVSTLKSYHINIV